MIKIVIATPFYGRELLTSLYVNYYNYLDLSYYGIELQLIGAHSNEYNIDNILTLSGVPSYNIKNIPLSFKWNSLIKEAREYYPDYLVILGSDDFVSPEYFANMVKNISIDEIGGLRDFYILNSGKGELGYFRLGDNYTLCNKPNTIGAGRIFGKNVLDKLDWIIFIEKYNKGIEFGTDEILFKQNLAFKAFFMEELHCIGVDVKTDLNIWNFDTFKSRYNWMLKGKKEISKLLSKIKYPGLEMLYG